MVVLDFKAFRNEIPEKVDFRPALKTQVRLFIENNRVADDSSYGPDGYVLTEAKKLTGYAKRPRTRPSKSEPKLPSDTILRGRYKNEVDAWSRTKSSARGDPKRAIAVLYFLFRKVPNPTFFKEVAKHVWSHDSETFMRFIYAKYGGDSEDSFEDVCERFRADIDVVRREFEKLWTEEKPPFKLELPPRSSQIYHYTSKDAVEILGRDGEQAALKRFRDAGPGFRWWQIAGVAGQGKSRLALDLVNKTRQELPNWQVGFLEAKELSRFQDRWKSWVPEQPCLIIIDYVLAISDPLKTLIQSLAARQAELAHPICLLLLERQAWNFGGFGDFSSSKADWYCRIAGNPSGEDDRLEAARYRDQDVPKFDNLIDLTALDPDQLAEIVTQVAKNGEKQIVDSRKTIRKTLAKIDDQGRPLYAYFLGKALGAGNDEATRDAESLLDWVLKTDRRRRWTAIFEDKSVTPDTGDEAPDLPNYSGKNPAMHIALLATMIGELNCNDFYPDDPAWVRHNHDIRRQALILADNYISPSPGSEICGLQPDLLGEWFVLRSMERQRGFLNLVDLAWKLAPGKMAEFLTRISRDFPDLEMTATLLNGALDNDGINPRAACSPIASDLFAYLFRADASIPAGVLRILEYAADTGEGRAMAHLGFAYSRGIGVAINRDTGFHWCRRGVEAGDGTSMTHLGVCYECGWGTDQDMKMAVHWFRKGAEAGDGRAMANLGKRYAVGGGCEKDIRLALDWFRKGAAIGHGGSMANLGVCFQRGDGVERNMGAALTWYRKGAEAGDGGAMSNLGVCYDFGNGVARDINVALEWYRFGARVGNDGAMNKLGECYKRANGVTQDMETAIYWFKKAASSGNGAAMNSLGIVFAQGQCVEKNFETALDWFRNAAIVGNVGAMTNLGMAFERGDGVAPNRETAIYWYEKATQAGDEFSRARLIELGESEDPPL